MSAYANWGQRVLAYLIDVAPVIIVIFVLARISVALLVIGWLVGLGWSIYNRWYLGGTTGQSIGKKALNIRLVSEESGQPIGMLMAFVRDICHIVDSIICYIGYLFPLWDAKRQTIADKIVKTVVVPA
ncbi:MAG: RDD family protein [Streptosporangiaceae bacterium]